MEIFEIDKKVANYNDSPHNYTVDQHATSGDGAEFRELTVTITLAEYRELVSKTAVSAAEIERERKLRTDAEKRVADQAAEIDALRAALRASNKAEREV